MGRAPTAAIPATGGVGEMRRRKVSDRAGVSFMSTDITSNRSAAAPTITPSRRRPSGAGYWVGTLVAVLATLGALAWAAFAFLGWRADVQDFPRFEAPGTAVVSLTDTGTQFVYLEHDRSTPISEVPSVTVTGPAGTDVRVTAYSREMRYDVPGVSNQIGDAVFTFHANEVGSYRVTVADAAPGTTVAVGDDLLWAWGPQVVGVVALLLGGLLVGLTMVIVTAVRRSGPAS